MSCPVVRPRNDPWLISQRCPRTPPRNAVLGRFSSEHELLPSSMDARREPSLHFEMSHLVSKASTRRSPRSTAFISSTGSLPTWSERSDLSRVTKLVTLATES